MEIILVNNLGKKYKRYPNHWMRLAEWMSGGRCLKHIDQWALRGISFKINSGEAVGIVGPNGAGKSTLLKILARTTNCNEGSLKIKGRIAALLELGMGFHPDFTGRENAIMACKMAGLGPDEIRLCLPEIENFSELGDYMDQPLRVYSSGMHMRLAFSAATATRPEILIVDEALSVGDAYFQHKSMKRIREFKEQGTTLLFVSHDPGAVKSLCNRALLFDQGILIRDGVPDYVLDYYNAMIAKKQKDEEIRQVESESGRISIRSGTGDAIVQHVDILDKEGRSSRAFSVGDKVQIKVRVDFKTRVDNPTIGIAIRDRLGNDVFGTNTYHMKVKEQSYFAGESIDVVFTLPLNLGYGNYSLAVAVHSHHTHLENNYDWWDQCLVFQVIPNNSFFFIGTSALLAEVKMKRRHIDGRDQ